MNEQNENKFQVDSQFREAFGENWLRYLALTVTAALTGFAGWSLTNSWLYALAVVGLAEGASLFWTAQTDRNGNPTQSTVSVIGMILAWGSIIATDLSSAAILGNMANLEVFSVFAQVPELAQKVVVYVLPVLSVGHGILATAWYFFSEKAATQREINKTMREARKQVEQARAEAAVNIAKAQAAEYAKHAKVEAPKIGQAAGAAMWQQEHTPAQAAEAGNPVPFSGDGKAK